MDPKSLNSPDVTRRKPPLAKVGEGKEQSRVHTANFIYKRVFLLFTPLYKPPVLYIGVDRSFRRTHYIKAAQSRVHPPVLYIICGDLLRAFLPVGGELPLFKGGVDRCWLYKCCGGGLYSKPGLIRQILRKSPLPLYKGSTPASRRVTLRLYIICGKKESGKPQLKLPAIQKFGEKTDISEKNIAI